MPSDDLKEHATSDHDFYELLGITFETSESDIRRAYRKAALKYHPDKNAGKPEVVEKFHLLQIAYDVLSDPAIKALYDNARRAKRENEERNQAFQGKRKQMKEDLERRESAGLKRKRDDDDEQAKFDRELRRLAEDGARRIREMKEKLSREALEEEERLDRERNGEPSVNEAPAPSHTTGGTNVPELDRSVKVRWVREGPAQDIDKDRLTALFQVFGSVEAAFLLKDKKQRIGDRKSKTLVATGVIVFHSVVATNTAVEDYKKQTAPEFACFDSVYWAAGQPPDFVQRLSTPKPAHDKSSHDQPARDRPAHDEQSPATPTSKSTSTNRLAGQNSLPSTPLPAETQGGGGLRKVPSFASFKTPQSAQSPSLEELTLIRMKNAEKRRLEEQIRASEAAEDEST